MPSAAEIEVEEWPTPKVSYSLSSRFGNGATPSFCFTVVDGVAAAGEDLVRIGLMADVPDDAVVRGVVEVVQGGGEFDHPQPGAEMAAAASDRFDQISAQFVGRSPRSSLFGELAQIGGNWRCAKGAGNARQSITMMLGGRRTDDSGYCPPSHRMRGGKKRGMTARRNVQVHRQRWPGAQRPRRRSDQAAADLAGRGIAAFDWPVRRSRWSRLALMKSITSSAGTLLAAAISAMVDGPFIIAVAMRKWRGYSRSVCGHLLSTKRPSGLEAGQQLALAGEQAAEPLQARQRLRLRRATGGRGLPGAVVQLLEIAQADR